MSSVFGASTVLRPSTWFAVSEDLRGSDGADEYSDGLAGTQVVSGLRLVGWRTGLVWTDARLFRARVLELQL